MYTINPENHAELPYLHDRRLQKFEYDEKNKSIVMDILNEFDDVLEYRLVFTDVHGFEMQACDPWGPSPYIFSFVLLEGEERKTADKMKALHDDQHNDPWQKRCGDLDQCLEVEFCMTSGNTLNIVCRTIEVEQQAGN